MDGWRNGLGLRGSGAALGLVLVGLLLPGGCGPVTGGRALADERVLRGIREHYDAHALEDPSCGAPFITRMRSGQFLQSMPEASSFRVAIDYGWEAPAVAPGAEPCQGEGRRTFTVFRSAEGPVVTAMSGPTR